MEENTASGQNIGRPVAAVDPDGGTLTYSLRDDKSWFTIDSATGQLKTKGALDHESKTSYDVMVSVSDGRDDAGKVESDPQTDITIWVTINVSDVDE